MKMNNIRNNIKTMAVAAVAAMTFFSSVSCDNADELPPLNEGYATTVVMPDPVDLTSEDRAYIQQLQDEYNAAVSGN